MTVHRAAHSIATMCRVLEVSPSGYYAWHTRPRSHRVQTDAELRERIRGIHAHSRGTYGVPRIHAELVATGTRVSRKRVARLMRQAGLRGVRRAGARHPTWCSERSRPPARISSGSPISPTSRPGVDSSTWPWCSMPGVAVSSAGRWRRICARPSCSRPSTWP